MTFTVLFPVLLFCSLTLGQDDANASNTDTEIYHPMKSAGSPEMYDLLKKFGAMGEKLQAIETKLKETESRLKNSETKLLDFENRLKDSETKLKESETRRMDSENRLRNSETQIMDLRTKERTKVVFSAAAGVEGAVGPYNIATTIVYKDVKANIGGAYGNFTGIFTAPVAGVYYFTIFHHAGKYYETVLFLYKNDQKVITSENQKRVYENDHNGGNAVFLQLQRGDQVYVKMPANSHIWGSNYHTTFSGFLVSQI